MRNRLSRHLPKLALVIIVAILGYALVQTRAEILAKTAIFTPCESSDADVVLVIDITHPVGSFAQELIHLKRVDKPPEDAYISGHFGHGHLSDSTQEILCGQSLDFKSSTRGNLQIQVFAYCITHGLSAPAGAPPLIDDELEHVIVNFPTYGESHQQLGQFTVQSRIERINKRAVNPSRR